MDFKKFQLTAIVYCCCCYAASQVLGDCSFSFSVHESKWPKLYKNIGSRKTLINTKGIRHQIPENIVITADCETSIQRPGVSYGKRSIDLNCTQNHIYVDDIKLNSYLHLWCYSNHFDLYESSQPFDWCPTPMTSYLLARPVNDTYVYYAGICYNLEQQQILTAYYSAAYQLSKYKYPTRLENYPPSTEIEQAYKHFESHRINPTLLKNVELQQWLQFAQYDNQAIIQDPNLFTNPHNPIGGLLEFHWWPNLHSGNWHRYEKALKEHIETDKEIYEILEGVSGAVAVPFYGNGSGGNYSMVEVTYWHDRKIPLYIWQYLKSKKDNGKDVVVIAVNSAFTDFYEEKELIFCTDICHKIDWLKAAISTFRYKTMGLIFCCDVDEVKLSKRLEGFALPSEPARIEDEFDDFNESILKYKLPPQK
ncbi:uncharacterized protein LOC105262102 [Musca domestica]|uniref:Uncharacterized protein LOC105262102 n=1 Tax=Musca domestica TaxID=7370 RepID=A0A1I8NIV7_MUSDO|nr:uncharacterized protein LOC105262102 [Musca domestica]